MEKNKVAFCTLLLFTIIVFTGTSSFTAEKVELNFVEAYTNPARKIIIEKIISDFEELHPNIKVNLISPPYDEATQKIILMMTSKQPIDIVETKADNIGMYVGNKFLDSLEERLDGWSDFDTLLPAALALSRLIDNTSYAIPSSVYSRTMYYRTDVLDKLGVSEIPETLQELFDICKNITNPSKDQFGFTFRGKNQQMDMIHYMVLPFLDDLDTKDLYKKIDGRLIWDDPRTKEGLELYARFYHEASPKDSINWGFNEQINAFGSGITPFILQDADFIGASDETIGREKFMMAPMPVGPYGKSYTILYFPSLAIPAHSKHKDEAWEFIKYFLSPEVNAYFTKNSSLLPIHSVTFENDPYFGEGIFQPWAYMMDHPEKYVSGQPPINSPKYAEWFEIANDDLQAFLLGNLSVDDMTNKWVEYWQ